MYVYICEYRYDNTCVVCIYILCIYVYIWVRVPDILGTSTRFGRWPLVCSVGNLDNVLRPLCLEHL